MHILLLVIIVAKITKKKCSLRLICNNKKKLKKPHQKTIIGRSTRKAGQLLVSQAAETSQEREATGKLTVSVPLQELLKHLKSKTYEFKTCEYELLFQEPLKHLKSKTHDVKLNAHGRVGLERKSISRKRRSITIKTASRCYYWFND